MELSSAAEAKLKAWYGSSTWHTPHMSDMNRWYDFVSQYRMDHGYEVPENDLREHIEYKLKEKSDPRNEMLSNIIRNRISLMINILDFLQQTGR